MIVATKLPICLLAVLATAFAQKPAAAPSDALHQLSAQMETLSHNVSRAVVQIFSTTPWSSKSSAKAASST
jgi:hypothetical protein